MRKVHIDNVEPGTILAKAIFNSDGRILLSSGVELKKGYIERLKQCSVMQVYIEDEMSRDIDISEAVCDQTRIEAKLLVKNLMNNYSFSKTIDADQVKETIGKIIDELLSSRNILVNLSDIKSVDDYTFEHSVNVCILSLITGVGLGYSRSRLKDLGVGALLHDIGKLKIPEDILKKPSQLTVEEFEEIKKHTVYGYEILKENKNISIVSAYIAFGHHERLDGSGYPLQLKGNNIHQCAKIVAVADVYDALTSDRVYRKKLRPHEVFEYITALATHHFDQEVINSFIKYVAIYPAGTGVVLNTNERGIVVQANRTIPTRPVVRIIYNSQNEKLDKYYEMDLTQKLNIFIIDSCEI